jgi:hypothetical protein
MDKSLTPFGANQQVYGDVNVLPLFKLNPFSSMLSSLFSDLTIPSGPQSGGTKPLSPYFARVVFTRSWYTDDRPFHKGVVYYTSGLTVQYGDGRVVDYVVRPDGTIRDGQGNPLPFKISVPAPSVGSKMPPGVAKATYIDKTPADYTGPPVSTSPVGNSFNKNKNSKTSSSNANKNSPVFDFFSQDQTTNKVSSPLRVRDFPIAPTHLRR